MTRAVLRLVRDPNPKWHKYLVATLQYVSTKQKA